MDKSVGCLIIHGFGGNVHEVRPLAVHLTDQGYKVFCPSLKGHTGRREDLQGVRYQDWLASAEEGLRLLQDQCKVIFIVGFSMGGLLAIQLGIKYNLAGIVTVNAPIFYLNIKRSLLNSIKVLLRRDFKTISRNLKASRAVPFSSFQNFRLLVKVSKPLIKELRCPIFVAQGTDDPAVRKSSADYIYQNTGSLLKRREFYPCSQHLIFLSPAGSLVIKDIMAFMSLLESRGGGEKRGGLY